VAIYLKQIREEKKMPLRQLARLSGVSIAQLSKIERGLSDPTFTVMCEIAHALRTPCHKVFVSKYDVDTEE
jgi:transcriptional regulator with XRE-family HTH domain